MKSRILILIMLCFSLVLPAQKHICKTAHVKFYSYTPIEEIEANNRQVVSILDTQSGEIQFSLLIKAFDFKRALMQEHFNENYMESDKFPKSNFKGKIENLEEIDFSKDGEYKANVTGDMTIHGVTKKLNLSGIIKVVNGLPVVESSFTILPADYDVVIPSLVEDKIAKELEVTVKAEYQ